MLVFVAKHVSLRMHVELAIDSRLLRVRREEMEEMEPIRYGT